MYILDINPISDFWFLSIFSHFVCLFVLWKHIHFIGKRELPLESLTVAGYEFELDHGMFWHHWWGQRSLSPGALVSVWILTVILVQQAQAELLMLPVQWKSEGIKTLEHFDLHLCTWVIPNSSQRSKSCPASWSRGVESPATFPGSPWCWRWCWCWPCGEEERKKQLSEVRRTRL